MFYPLARFVDAIGSETIRLDLNDGTFRVGDETKSEAFGQPEWEAEPGDVGGTDGYRTTSLQILCGKSKKAATRAYHRLALELQRPINYLLWQDSPKSEPRWIRVYRSQLPVMSYEYVGVDDHPDGGQDVWQVTLELSSDPYAYGRPVTLHRQILNLPDDRPRATTVGNYAPNPSIEVSDRGWVGGQQQKIAQAVAGASVYGAIPELSIVGTNHLLNPGYDSYESPETIRNHIRNPRPVDTSNLETNNASSLRVLEPGKAEVVADGQGATLIIPYGDPADGKTDFYISVYGGDTVRTKALITAPSQGFVAKASFRFYNLLGTVTHVGDLGWDTWDAGETKEILSMYVVPEDAVNMLVAYHYQDTEQSATSSAGLTMVIGHFLTVVNNQLAPYFDGDTPPINGTHEWEGTPNASASIGTAQAGLDSWWAQPEDTVKMLPTERVWPGKLGRQSAALRRRLSEVVDLSATPTAEPVSGVEGDAPVRARATVGRRNTAAGAPPVTAHLAATFTSDTGAEVGTRTGDTLDVTAATTLEIDTTAPPEAAHVRLTVNVHQEAGAPETVNRIYDPTFGKISTEWWAGRPAGETDIWWRPPGGTAHVVAYGNDTTYVVPLRDDGSAEHTEYEPINAGQTARMRAVLSATDQDIGAFIRIWYYDGAKKSLGGSDIIRENGIGAGESRTLNLESVAPDGAAYGVPRVYLTTATGSKPPNGLTMALHFVALTVDQPMPAGTFDGTTPDTDTDVYRWQGLPWASPTLIVPSEPVDIDGCSLALNEPLLPIPFDGSTQPWGPYTFDWTGAQFASPSVALATVWQWSTDSLGDVFLSDEAGAQESVWTLSAWVGAVTTIDVTPSVVWLDKDGETVAKHDGEATRILGNTTARTTVTSIKPAGAVRGRFVVDGRGGTTSRPFMDAVMFEQSATATGYQDGDSAGWAWTGAAGLSTSGPVDPTTGRPAHAILSANDLLGDGPANVTLRLKPSTPWHIAEPLIQVTAFESPGSDVSPVVINFGPEDSGVSGFTHNTSALWIDVDPRVTWNNLSNVRWIDL